jgi:hypothetical protein
MSRYRIRRRYTYCKDETWFVIVEEAGVTQVEHLLAVRAIGVSCFLETRVASSSTGKDGQFSLVVGAIGVLVQAKIGSFCGKPTAAKQVTLLSGAVQCDLFRALLFAELVYGILSAASKSRVDARQG